MAGNVEGHHTPSSTPSPSGYDYQPFHWGNQVNQVRAQLFRSVSENQAIPPSSRERDKQVYGKWRAALRCKQHVGTKEWINCKQASCLHLRGELHHLLDCPYRLAGGCQERCLTLREELKKFRELTPKYSTISDEELRTRSRQDSFSAANDELQAKLQALTIEEYVANSRFSPNSPLLEEPLPSLLQRDENEREQPSVRVVELVPLDQAHLSVSNGHFRKGHEWQKLCFLGKGTFGSTYLCVDIARNAHFAIKKLPVSSFQVDEVKLWRKLTAQGHPNILDLYGAIEREEHVLIFMEYMNGGSVGDYLAEYGPLAEKKALNILEQVLSGLDYMHRLGIVHGDIKAANILMDDLCLHIKLADFGSCVDLNSLETSEPSRLAGTLAFMAPEVCRSEPPLPSSDIWSSMCLLIQMLSAEAPWDEYRHQGDALLFVIGSAKRPPKLPQCSEFVQEIFAQGLNVIASFRPTAAQLLRHCVFDFANDDIEVDANNWIPDERDFQFEEDMFSQSDDSTAEYHSLTSLETSGEYFSTEDDFDGPDTISNKKAKPLITKDMKRVDSRGGFLRITNAHVTIPAKAIQDNKTIAISSIDPEQFYQFIIDNGIQDKVTILGKAFKLRPHGLAFRENISIKVTLPEALHQSEDLRIFHGTFNENNRISWTDVGKLSPVLPFKDSAVVNVAINHFSVLLFVKSLPSFACEFISNYFNYHPALFRFIVLSRREMNNPKRLVIRIAIVRDSFYLNTSKEIFKNHYICHKLIEEGFSEMFGSRREYICPKENFDISVEGVVGDIFCRPKCHTVQNVFGGEEVATWELDTTNEVEPICGTVKMKRAAGQVYRFQFWEHEPTRYVKDVLKLSTLRYSNMLPLARALGLNQEEMIDLVENTGGDEEKQLRQITEQWKTNAENNELPQMKKFVSSVPLEAILVSKRGQSHLSQLLEFWQKWSENVDSESGPLGEDLYFKTMAENGEHICQSVFSDCLFQVDHSEQAVCWAACRSELSNVIREVLKAVEKESTQSVLQKLRTLVKLLISYDKEKTRTERCKQFCEHLFYCIPWLMQVVKDCFKVHCTTQPSGLWGIESAVVLRGEEQEDKAIPAVWCEISELLKKLCELNSPNNDVSELEILDKKADVSSFLGKLSITDKEWLCYAARIRYYHLFAKEIMKGDLSRTHSQDLTNLFQCLRRYVSFCPTRLVHFSFPTGTVRKQSLTFDQSCNTFTQKCRVIVEDSSLNIVIKVEVYIKGSRLSAERHLTVKRCEQLDESHGECETLVVEYHHQYDQNGLLKITNDCKNFRLEEIVTIRVEAAEETVTDGNSNVLIKEGCPEKKEIYELAGHVIKEWKPMGRILLSPNEKEVNEIDVDQDRHGVKEKTIAMLERWIQIRGSEATYEVLYKALVDNTVKRKDVAEKYCVVRRS